jgi:hypothetical protein
LKQKKAPAERDETAEAQIISTTTTIYWIITMVTLENNTELPEKQAPDLAPPALEPDPDHVREFVQAIATQAKAALQGNKKLKPGLLQISRLHPTEEKMVPNRFAVDDVEQMVQRALTDNETGHNVFIEGRLVRRELRGNARGTLEDTVAVFALVVDSDADKGMGWTPTIQLSMIIETSPGNFHYWFFLKQAVNAAEGKRLGDRIRAAVKADHDTGTVTQPYRIAGAVNYASPKKRERGRVTVEARLVGLNPEVLWTPEDIEREFPEIGRKHNGNEEEHTGTFDESDIPADTFKVIREGVEKDDDRSLAFWNVVLVLTHKGWTVDGITTLLEKCPNGIAKKYQGRLRHEVERAYGKMQPTYGQSEEPTQCKITATPYLWCDPKLIPPRDFLYGQHYIRRYLSGTVAMGAVGKSSEVGVEIAAMVTGRGLLSVMPKRQLRVWYINLEDPRDEIDRRMAAVFQHYGITPADIGDRLFIDSGRERKIVVARETKSALVIVEPVLADLLDAVRANKIDVLMVDPFVGCYEINENDNSKINAVCQEWATFAEQGRCAIDLCHHVRKGGSLAGHTIEDARGATAIINSCRSVRVFNTMTKEEGEKAGVEKHRSYFRIDNGKANLAPPPDKSEWRKFVSVDLDNATEESEADHIGVVTMWQWPDPMDKMTVHDLRRAQKAVSQGGPWRKDSQAKNWVGIPIAAALGLDPKDRAHAAKIKGIIKIWLSTYMLKEVEGQDEKRNPRTFIEVDRWAND